MGRLVARLEGGIKLRGALAVRTRDLALDVGGSQLALSLPVRANTVRAAANSAATAPRSGALYAPLSGSAPCAPCGQHCFFPCSCPRVNAAAPPRVAFISRTVKGTGRIPLPASRQQARPVDLVACLGGARIWSARWKVRLNAAGTASAGIGLVGSGLDTSRRRCWHLPRLPSRQIDAADRRARCSASPGLPVTAPKRIDKSRSFIACQAFWRPAPPSCRRSSRSRAVFHSSGVGTFAVERPAARNLC